MARNARAGLELGSKIRELQKLGDEERRLSETLPMRMGRRTAAAYARLRGDPQMSEVTRQLGNAVVDGQRVSQDATQQLRDAVCREVQRMDVEELRDLINGCGGPLQVKGGG
jgi:hypothetical protein